MTVYQLIKELEKVDGDRIVILSADREGNNYSPLDGMFTGNYRAVTTWYGEIDDSEGKPALVLIPVN